MIGTLKTAIRSYRTTLFSSVMIGFVSVHTLEDMLLMSIGRFLPVPLLAMYGLGLIVSWLVMGVLVNRMMGNRHVAHGPGHVPGREPGWHGPSDDGMDDGV